MVKRRVQLDGCARPVPRAFAGLNVVLAAEQHAARVARRAVGQPAPRRVVEARRARGERGRLVGAELRVRLVEVEDS